MKKIIASLVLSLSAASVAPAALAQQDADIDAAKIKREMAIFEKLMGAFDTGDGAPIDEGQLALARITTGKILPDGTYGEVMEATFDQMLAPMMGLFSQMEPSQISAISGVDEGAVYELDEAALSRVGELLDPNAKARGAKIIELMVPLLKDAFTEIEPALREGMARAYARKFSAEQLNELNAFFDTPTGSFYASESFILMADPEIMNASMQAMPAMMENVLAAIPEMEGEMKDIPEPRSLNDLSDSELDELAQLLSVDVADLKEYRDNPPEGEAEEY